MAIPTSITDLSTSESLNSPAGSDPVGGTLDNYLRAHASIIKLQFASGANVNSAATLQVPADGSYFYVNNVISSISGFANAYNGRIVRLRFQAGITLVHSNSLILPTGENITTRANDVAEFVNESSGVWRCLNWSGMAKVDWRSKCIGEVFAIRSDVAGYSLMPPINDPNFRFIVLSAGASYNSGALINESVTGSSPNVVATAQVDWPASPFHGSTVNLINTERRFLRAGSSGGLQESAIESHDHTASANTAGAHNHTGTALANGAHTHQMTGVSTNNQPAASSAGAQSPMTTSPYASTGTSGEHSHTLSIGSNGAHSHAVTVNATGTTETRVRNLGVSYFMRIA